MSRLDVLTVTSALVFAIVQLAHEAGPAVADAREGKPDRWHATEPDRWHATEPDRWHATEADRWHATEPDWWHATEPAPPSPEPQAATKRDPPALEPAPPTPAEPTCRPAEVALPELLPVPALDVPIPPIEDATGHLALFYERLARFVRGKATDHLRIGVYGDSNGTKDYLTGEMRRYLQARHGDAGHGFIALAKPWDWYLHRDVRTGLEAPYWDSHAVSKNWFGDAYYGHGLIAAETRIMNVRTWVETAEREAPIGRTVDSLDVWYMSRPGGGVFDVMLDGAKLETVSTRGPTIAPGFLHYDVPDAPHKLMCISRGDGKVRLLGAVLERKPAGKPSFVIDALSVGGASWRTMLREDPEFDRHTLARRRYDLLVLHMGTNTWHNEKNRAETMREVIRRFRAAAPGTPILVMDPPDHHDDGVLIATEVVPEQRRIARELGVAFFDFHRAMGGLGSMSRFWLERMSQGDIVHFNAVGGAYMARRVMRALWQDFAEWLAKHPSAGCV